MRVTHKIERAGLWILGAFTLIAVAGYASFGRHPELIARFPGAVEFYSVSFAFFAQGHILIAAAALIAYLAGRVRMAWLGAFAAVYAASLFSEVGGTSIGFPFGDYDYSALLGWKWFDLVPWLIPLSWFAMAVPSFVIAMRAFSDERPWSRIVFAAYLLVLWDLALDPAMSYLAPYWRWTNPGAFYGMPAVNLFGWALTAVVIMGVLHWMRAGTWMQRLSPRWMTAYYLLTLAMPFGMIVAAGLWWAVLATLVALAVAAFILRSAFHSDDRPTPDQVEASPVDDEEEDEPEAVSHFFQRHSRSFSFAARWFPARQRRLVASLYMLCRTIDDLVDHSASKNRAEVARELDDWLRQVRQAYDGRPTGIKWLDEVMTSSRRAGLPFQVVEDLFEGVRSDLGGVRIETWEDLHRYTYQVASVVGIWMCYLFGVRSDEMLLRAAHLGRAMQMTNILRDVGEDLRQDRVYLPAVLLREHGLSAADLKTAADTGVRPEAYRKVLDAFVERTDAYYAYASPAIAMLPNGFAPATAVASAVYRGIHAAVRANGYDNLNTRAATSTPTKVRLAAVALLGLWSRQASRGVRTALGLSRATTDVAFDFAGDGSAATPSHIHLRPRFMRERAHGESPIDRTELRTYRPASVIFSVNRGDR